MEPRAQVKLALGRERDAKMCINVSVHAEYMEVDRCSALLLLFTHEVEGKLNVETEEERTVWVWIN